MGKVKVKTDLARGTASGLRRRPRRAGASRDAAPVWKLAAGALSAALLTGAAAWLTFDQRAVARDEVARMIAADSPYLQDRGVIMETLRRNSRTLEQVAADVAEIKIEMARLGEMVKHEETKGH